MKQDVKTVLKRNLPILIAVPIGAVAGYLYYRFVGCASGTCAITSSPYISTLYGGVIGWLIGSVIKPGGCCSCATGSCKEDRHE